MAIGLIIVDSQFNGLGALRKPLGIVAEPFHAVVDLPQWVSGWIDNTMRSHQSLQQDNSRLQAENLVLQGKLQQLAALSAENSRLRKLLNSSREVLSDRVLIGELIRVSPDPVQHYVVINKGSEDGVYVGQPVLDAYGLLGQIVDVYSRSSRLLLITDLRHALPVQVRRNGVRAIVEGSGMMDKLRLRHMAATTDIRVGDVLESSGLGERFPVGYPVAVVDSVEIDPGQAFIQVMARPTAHVDRSRHVLLVFTERRQRFLDGSAAEVSDDSPRP